MEKLVNNKKYLTLILVGLLTMIIGVSLSYIYFDLSTGDNSIQSGQISMTYIEPSNEIVLKDQLPISDELGKNQDKYFEFSVISNATTNENDNKGVDIFYEISLSKTEVEDIYNELEDKDIKVYLTKIVGTEEKVVVQPTLISELEKSNYGDSIKIYDTKNKHKNNNGAITTKYRLRFWIDNNVDATNWYKEDKYEYRFVVNINAHAPHLDLTIDNTLATKIKRAYNPENGAAIVDKDGYHYLQGSETELDTTDNPTLTAIESYVMLGNVYLYRQEVGGNAVQPTGSIKKLTDTKKYEFNVTKLNQDIKNTLLASPDIEISEEQYNAMVEPFGGYVQYMIAYISGMANPNTGGYIGDYTIEDIPTIEETLANTDTKDQFLETMRDIVGEILIKNTNKFTDMYYANNKFNEELLNANLEESIKTQGMEAMLPLIKEEFGNVSNFVLAQVSGLVDQNSDTPALIEGKTIEDIPTFEELIVNSTGPVLLANNYIKINNILWEIIGVNEDDSIRLVSTEQMKFTAFTNQYTGGLSYTTIKIPYLETTMARYFGYNNESNAGFLKSIKDTTLEDIILKRNYEYEEDGIKKTVSAYVSLPTYEDIKRTIKNEVSFLSESKYKYWTVGKISDTNSYSKFYLTNYNASESRSSEIEAHLLITIKNIEVLGEGTKQNPYYIENETIISEENLASAITSSLLDGVSPYGFELFETEEIGYNSDNSFSYSYSDGSESITYSSGAFINNKCYFETFDGKKSVVESEDSCYLQTVKLSYQSQAEVYTYTYNPTTISITTENAKTYQWQQKVGDKWVDLEDLTGRISGTKTSELTFVPTPLYNTEEKFRCVVSNDISKTVSKEVTAKITMTDGEWVYEEIDDTNKYQIIAYIGDYTNSLYFSTSEKDSNKYNLLIPSTIDGNVITKIQSFENDGLRYTIGISSTFNQGSSSVDKLEIASGIEEINTSIRVSNATKIIFNEGLKTIGQRIYSDITDLTLPNSVEVIGDNVFEYNELTSLTLPNNLKTIGAKAFYESPLRELILPNNLKTIGNQAFYGSILKELKLPNKLESIGEEAFKNSYLTTLEVPGSVKTIGTGSFYYSPLTKLVLNEGIEKIGGDTATLIERPYPNRPTWVVKTPYYNGAFANAQLTELILPNSLKEIGPGAFFASNIKTLTIPSSVRKIDEAAFYNSELTQLVLNEGIEEILGDQLHKIDGIQTDKTYYGAFANAKIRELILPKTLKTIGKGAFEQAELKSLTLNQGLEKIDDFAFYTASLTELEIPSSVKDIGGGSFYNSPLKNLIINEGLERIRGAIILGGVNKLYGAFHNATLSEITLPKSLKSIGATAFYSSQFKELTLPENLEYIGDFAFYSAELTELEIPAKTKTIDSGAFFLSPLDKLILHEGLEEILTEHQTGFNYAPVGGGGIYENTSPFYSATFKTISLPSSIKTMEKNAFKYDNLKTIEIYGKTSLNDFLLEDKDILLSGESSGLYTIKFVPGTLN